MTTRVLPFPGNTRFRSTADVRAAVARLPEAERRALVLAVRRVAPAFDLHTFVRSAWPIVEPTTAFVDGDHIRTICAHLEALTNDQFDDLLLNIPPRYMKSLLVSVFWPAWVWTRDVGARFLYASYSQKFATRDSVKTRRIVESPWYQRLWPGVRIVSDQNEKMRFDLVGGGFRLATSVTGGSTGEGADYLVADDPHNAKEIWSETKRLGVIEWWDDVMSSRTGRKATNKRVVVMQRLHEQDLSGHLLAERDTYVHVFLPQEYDPNLKPGRPGQPPRTRASPLGRVDWRTTPGELLWPQRFTPAVVARIKLNTSAYAYGGQYQQVPSPPEGELFRRLNWRFWEPPDEDFGPIIRKLPDGSRRVMIARKLPFEVEYYFQTWDFSFKGRAQSRSLTREVDFVAGQVWCKAGADAFLMARINERMDFPSTIRAVRDLSKAWPEAERKFYEDAANGPAIEATLRGEIGGLIPVPAEGSLEAAAHAITWLHEAGHLYLPHPVMCPWVEAFIDQWAAFPEAAHDDEVAAGVRSLRRVFPMPKLLPDELSARVQRAFPIFQTQ